MYENVRGRAKRVLVVGTPSGALELSPQSALAPDGLLIVMESDATRAAELRQSYMRDGLGSRATIIGGDPRRMLYKLAGPFDAIFCAHEYLAVRQKLEHLLAPDGVLITNGDT
jgi:predicted O-methyltransferase YrrM